MKNKRFLFLLIGLGAIALLARFIFFQPQPRKLLLEDSFLYGNVKSIKERIYKAKLAGNQVVKGKRWIIDYPSEDVDYAFDPEGKITQRTIYQSNDAGISSYTQKYIYNKNGLLIKTISTAKKPGNEHFIYNHKHQLIRQDRDQDDRIFRYDKAGKLISKTIIGSKNNKVFQYTYSYENGFIKTKDTYFVESGKHFIDEYKRDGNGNVIKHRLGASFDQLKSEPWGEVHYEFDSYHNWTKYIYYYDEKPVCIREREITYY